MYLGKDRKLNRWTGYDYNTPGWYFITICTKDRVEYFGKVENDKMILNRWGEMAQNFWQDLPRHFTNCKLDDFVVMPNHIHGIIEIIENLNNKDGGINVGNADLRSLQHTKMFLPKIIHGFKSSLSREINKLQYFEWQKSFHDHVIRGEKDYNAIKYYIQQNPAKWAEDRNNPINIKNKIS